MMSAKSHDHALLIGALAMIVSLSACSSRARPPSTRSSDPGPLQPLAWLAGSWVGGHDGTATEEHWTVPRGNRMLGMNRTTRADGSGSFEFLRIERRADGIVYLASPGGRQPPTEFRLTEHSSRHAVFENPAHDFPQRIIYTRDQNTLRGRIEGHLDGQTRHTEWTWTRARLAEN